MPTRATCRTMPDCPQASKTDKWKLFLAALASLAILYLVLAPFNQPLYNLLLFPIPDPRIPSVQDELDRLRARGIESRFVEFRSANGRKIRGLFMRVPNAHRVFLYSHAKGNNLFGKLHVAENLLTCGGSVLSYDYQGYGQSEGKASIAGSCDDAVAAYDYLRNSEHYKAKDIIAYGESFGSGVTGH